MLEKVFGRHAVYHLIKANRRHALQLFIQEGSEAAESSLVSLARAKKIPVEIKPRVYFDRIESGSHQGVLAHAEAYPWVELQSLTSSESLLLCDGIQDPQNLGALCRTAYLLGVGGVVITENRAVSISAGVCKAAAGAVEYLKIAQVSSLASAINLLKENSFWVYGADQEGDKDLYEEQFTAKAAIVIGGEGKGLGRLVRERCDIRIKIPMLGQEIGSFNAATAAALLLGELARQRRKKTG